MPAMNRVRLVVLTTWIVGAVMLPCVLQCAGVCPRGVLAALAYGAVSGLGIEFIAHWRRIA
jgi:hypothetical protein